MSVISGHHKIMTITTGKTEKNRQKTNDKQKNKTNKQ